MALINLSTEWSVAVRLSVVAEELRTTALQAVNAPLAAEVRLLDENPGAALVRISKLDVGTAVEAVSYISNTATLQRLTRDKRDRVTAGVSQRARALGADLDVLARGVVCEATEPAGAPSPTAKALAKPVAEAVAALARLGSIDAAAVRQWAETLDADAPWCDVLSALCRHPSIAETVVHDAIARDVLDSEAAWAWNPVMTQRHLARYAGVMTTTLVALLERALADWSLPAKLSFTGITPSAHVALATASVPTKQLAGAATTDEVAAYLRSAIAAQPLQPLGHNPAIALIGTMFARCSDAGTVDAVTPLLDFYALLGGQARYAAVAAVRALLLVPGLQTDTVRALWGLAGAAEMVNVLNGERGPLPTEADLAWLTLSYGDVAVECFGLEELARVLSQAAQTDCLTAFVSRMLDTIPGAARVLLNAYSHTANWVIELVMHTAAGTLGTNASAWSVFFSQVDSHSGAFHELLEAAVIATAGLT